MCLRGKVGFVDDYGVVKYCGFVLCLGVELDWSFVLG